MSLLKILSPNSQDLGDAVATLIKIGSRGRVVGHDRSVLEKRAGANILYELDKLPRDPGEELIHLLAVGSTEKFGMNRNGDGFREPVLERTHPTFVKYGRFYRDHCFPAGTLVVMADRMRRPIEALREGDLVATLDGPRPVTAVMRQPYFGPGVQLRLNGDYRKFTATSEHPCYVLRREQVICRHKYSRLTASQHGSLCREFRDGLTQMTPEYVAAETIRVGDYLLLPRPQHGNTRVTPHFARLVGWIASEGYLGAAGLMQFTFSAKNTADIEAVTACLQQNGLRVTTTPRPETGCVMLSACGAKLHAEVSTYIVGVLDEKRLTGRILEWDRQSLLEMLFAYCDGDGHIAQQQYHAGQLRIRSASPQMLAMLADVLRALGAPATVQWDRKPGIMLSPTNGQTYHTHGSGVVTVSSGFSEQVMFGSRKTFVRKRLRQPSGVRWNNFYLVRVDHRETIELAEDVFNIEVAGPHHYLVNDVVVHNCNKDPAKSYGTVKLSAYHAPMSRVELICGLNATKEAAERNGGLLADREMEKLARGDSIAVSMACKVPFDVCSYCGNQAPTRKQYCDDIADGGLCKAGGLRKNIGRTVVVDGDTHQLHADNTEPTFFDISHVWRPADRIAYVSGALQKAAGADHVISGAELAEALGLTVPYTLMIAQDLPAKTAELLKLAHHLADLEQTTCCENSKLAFAASVQPPIAMPPGGHEKFAQVLRALADAGCMLTPRDFIRLVTDYDEKQASTAAEVVSAYLPCAFTRMTQDQNLPAVLQSNPYTPAPSATSDLHFWAEKQASAISLVEPHFTRRLHLACFRNEQVGRGDVRQAEKLAAAGGPAAELAKQYCLYQLAFLQSIPNPSHDFPLTAQRVSLHNHAR